MNAIRSLGTAALMAACYFASRQTGIQGGSVEEPSLTASPGQTTRSTSCALIAHGREVWTLELPFLLDGKAAFADGAAIMYGRVSHEALGEIGTSLSGDYYSDALAVYCVGESGKNPFVELVARRSNRSSHSGYYPTPIGVLVWNTTGIAVLRVSPSAGDTRSGEEWWIYERVDIDLKRAAISRPSRSFGFGNERRISYVAAVEPDLALIQWSDALSRGLIKGTVGLMDINDGIVLWRGAEGETVEALSVEKHGENLHLIRERNELVVELMRGSDENWTVQVPKK